MYIKKPIRVRFAPSPTGPLHIGGLRTALYNFIFAKKYKGNFILRIEDTDQNRYVPGAEEYIINSLNWCGIHIDEGVVHGGNYGPYRQSERKNLYKKYADELIANNKAYYAFDTPEELAELRTQYEKQKKTFTYNSSTRKTLSNSLALSEVVVEKKLKNGDDYVIRFKMPEDKTLVFYDKIRGKITVNTSTLDDKVLFKSDGMPTYHLANIIDDYLMKITHVIRGEEWLPSLPLHILLYEAFDWETPDFAHLPLILKPDGKGKLSKRDGDRLGFPVYPMRWKDPKTGLLSSGFKEMGFLPDAFMNFLLMLGWNPGTEKELFNLEEMFSEFCMEKIQKSGARFDFQKAKWFNQQYLKNSNDKILGKLLQNILDKKSINAKETFVEQVCGLIKDRLTLIDDLWEQSKFFFEAPETYDQKAINKRWKENSSQIMRELKEELINIKFFTSENIENKIKSWMTLKELGMGAVMPIFRLSIVGELSGPHLFDILEMIGKEECVNRIEKAVTTINK